MLAKESVWDYPRPPRVEVVPQTVRIDFAGRTIAETCEAKRVLETSHPPFYYLPRSSFDCVLIPSRRTSFCEWKGRAVYWSIQEGETIAQECAWSYPEPCETFAVIRDHLAVYPAAMDACWVDGEKVLPQPGGFYGGWITSNLVGPFKGAPGTMGW